MNQSPIVYPVTAERFDRKSFREKGYAYIDNFLPDEIFKKIHDKLTSQGTQSINPSDIAKDPWMEQFDWHYSPDVVGNRKVEKFEEQRTYFVRLLYLMMPLSQKWTPMIAGPILERLADLRQIQRVKVNLYPRDSEFIEHEPHADNTWEDAKGALFMVNTCNGFTRLHDGTKINSVGNRMLFFKPHLTHNSTNTTDALCRVTINFNYF